MRACKDRDPVAEIEAREALAEALIAKRIKAILADAPPLSDDRRNRLAELLKPVRSRKGRQVMNSEGT